MLVKSNNFMWKTYFILKAIHRGSMPDYLLTLIDKNEIYLSPKVELSSPLEMVHFETRSLSEQFRETCIKRFKKRYGEMFDLDIVECSSRENKTIQNRIKMDSREIKQRLSAGYTSPHTRARLPAAPARIEKALSQI